ncbi:MAG: hypothetical protein RJA63_871 [Pseudomonadota bacterium]|jgi:hypothetical protein
MLTAALGALGAAVLHRVLLKSKNATVTKIRSIVFGVDAGGGGGPKEPV